MATYTDSAGNAYTHDDDKLGFADWVNSNTEREVLWQVAASAHLRWQVANPTLHPSMAHDSANAMFQEWVDYANAIRTLPT
jgi:hypothetical protein